MAAAAAAEELAAPVASTATVAAVAIVTHTVDAPVASVVHGAPLVHHHPAAAAETLFGDKLAVVVIPTYLVTDDLQGATTDVEDH